MELVVLIDLSLIVGRFVIRPKDASHPLFIGINRVGARIASTNKTDTKGIEG